jgi:hypothetical protein
VECAAECEGLQRQAQHNQGRPYKTVATGVTSTTYTNTGLRPGVTYYYVATTVNDAGESGHSNQASAKARRL